MYSYKSLWVLLLMFANYSIAGKVYDEFPDQIQTDEKYVFYSHGLIVEGNNPRPVHSKYGAYEFSLIKSKLAEDSDFNLIAHHRPKNTEIDAYAKQLASWVERLVTAGVEPTNITLLGFSRGGEITAYTSSSLKHLNVNTILLATCWPTGVQSRPTITFGGHFLSVFETTDQALGHPFSCKEISVRSEELLSFEEVAISTGKEHGAFFKPMQEWIVPVKAWIKSKGS